MPGICLLPTLPAWGSLTTVHAEEVWVVSGIDKSWHSRSSTIDCHEVLLTRHEAPVKRQRLCDFDPGFAAKPIDAQADFTSDLAGVRSRDIEPVIEMKIQCLVPKGLKDHGRLWFA